MCHTHVQWWLLGGVVAAGGFVLHK